MGVKHVVNIGTGPATGHNTHNCSGQREAIQNDHTSNEGYNWFQSTFDASSCSESCIGSRGFFRLN